MSKHISRKRRWAQVDAKTYTSALGKVCYQQDAWYALLEYRTLTAPAAEGGLPTWLPHHHRLGPFKRPRNAMVALEREATVLRNRHGEGVVVGDPSGASRP
jgi:hypothetical protein